MKENPAILQKLTPSDVAYIDHKDKILDNFNKWIADGTHQMTILKDDGLYRHLRFKKPGRSEYWFDLITWPGNLTINGDMGTHTFARLDDMFEFFTSYINDGYWAEKDRGQRRSEIREHDEDVFKAWVVSDFWERRHDVDFKDTSRWWNAIRENVFSSWASDVSTDQGAREALRDIDKDCDSSYYESAWEDSWTTYPYHYLLCLAAILTGIRTYKATTRTESETSE